MGLIRRLFAKKQTLIVDVPTLLMRVSEQDRLIGWVRGYCEGHGWENQEFRPILNKLYTYEKNNREEMNA